MYTAAYLRGKPKRIASMFNTTYAPPPADDNAVSVVEFENDAIAVLETSFVSPYQANCFELLGTQGAITRVGRDDIKVRSSKFSDGWFTPDKLPNPLPDAIRMWIDAIEKGTDILFDSIRGTALTELLENAYISHNKQTIVKI
jgi:predicted dehydrogenase